MSDRPAYPRPARSQHTADVQRSASSQYQGDAPPRVLRLDLASLVRMSSPVNENEQFKHVIFIR